MNIFKKLAALIVTAYSNHIYRTALEKADELHRLNHRMYYVATNTFDSSRLTTYDRAKFKAEKRVYGHYAKLLTMQTLKNGCWYHTPDPVENQKMSDEEKERRRKIFVRRRLIKAKLAPTKNN